MAASTLETAARDLAMGKSTPEKIECARLYAEAAGYLQEDGETVRAADLKMRASKQVEAFDKDLAARFVDECIALFDGDSDKDVYAVEPLRKALQAHLALGKHASAMRVMDRLWVVWARLDQKHNLYKLVLSRVVLLLAAADAVTAQAEYDKHLDLPGFMAASESAASEDLLSAYSALEGGHPQHSQRPRPASLSLSLSLTHTHTHTHALPPCPTPHPSSAPPPSALQLT